MDKITAIKAMAWNVGDLVVDTIPSSLSNTAGTIFIDADKLIHPLTGQLKGNDHYIYEGAGAGEEHTITDFLPANNRAVFGRLFTATPSINSKFLIFKHFIKGEYDNALDRAIGFAKLRYLEEKVATMELIATQYEYVVPSGYEYINTLRLVPSGSTDYGADDEVDRIFELRSRYWRVEPNALGSCVIAFDPRKIDLQSFDNEWVNIVGQSRLNISATDNATIPEDIEEYLINTASMIMASQRITESKEWESKFRMFRDLSKGLEDYIHRQRFGKKVG